VVLLFDRYVCCQNVTCLSETFYGYQVWALRRWDGRHNHRQTRSCLLTLYGHIKTSEQRTIYTAVRWLVHWPLMGGQLHLVQRGRAWTGCSSAQSPLRCTKCNSPPINRQCTNFTLFDEALGSKVLNGCAKNYSVWLRFDATVLKTSWLCSFCGYTVEINRGFPKK